MNCDVGMNDQIKYRIFILCPFIFYLLPAPIIIKLFVYYEICPLFRAFLVILEFRTDQDLSFPRVHSLMPYTRLFPFIDVDMLNLKSINRKCKQK